jgi:hypothetical protein
MTPIAQPLGELGRKLRVNNEPHCLFGGNDDGMAELVTREQADFGVLSLMWR